MADPSQVTLVIPAFNEAAVIAEVVRGLRDAAAWAAILVIDDGSTDGTAVEAERAGASVVRHPYNKGNGASVKTGIRKTVSDFLLIVDADGQHSASDALRVAGPLGEFDLVVGSRGVDGQAGMARRLGNAALNGLASYLTGRSIPDLTSGLRGARVEHLRDVLHLLPNGFSTPTTTTLSFIKAGLNVTFVPIRARTRVGASKIRLVSDGGKFLLIIVRVMTIFSPLRVFLPVAALSFLLGAGYAVWTIATQRHVTNSSTLLIVLAVLLFAFGLVSEQIAALRMDGRK